jgi:hypothetical protein
VGLNLDDSRVVSALFTKDSPAPMVVVYRTDYHSRDSAAFRIELERRMRGDKFDLRHTPRTSAPDMRWVFIIPCYRDDDLRCEDAALSESLSGFMFAPRGAPIIPPPA